MPPVLALTPLPGRVDVVDAVIDVEDAVEIDVDLLAGLLHRQHYRRRAGGELRGRDPQVRHRAPQDVPRPPGGAPPGAAHGVDDEPLTHN